MDHGRISRCLLVLVLMLLTTSLPSSALATSSGLDSSFGTDGKITTDFLDGSDVGRSVAIQADGKIVVAGFAFNGSNGDFAVVRYTTTGSLDSTFGTGGKVATDFSEANETGSSVAIQADGKIVVAGTLSSDIDSNSDFAVTRYNVDGSLDETFGPDRTGKLTTDFFGDTDSANAVAIQADGKIVVAGSVANGSNYFGVARYNPNGSLDETFGPDGTGKVATDFFGTFQLANAMAIQADGKIVVAGHLLVGSNNNFDWAVVRYNPNGSLDETFGPDHNGKLTTDFFGSIDGCFAVAIQADGKIVVAGFAVSNSNGDGDLAVARYTTTGSLDPTFDTDGKLTTDFAGTAELGIAVATQADGRLVVAGYLETGITNADGFPTHDFAVVRYTATGSLDPTFATGGKATTDFAGASDIGFAAAIQADGKIVVAGSAVDPSTGDADFAVARYAKTSQAYTFHGFLAPLAPVSDGSIVNTGKAGRTYPVKWQLTDSSGASVTAMSAVTAIKQQSVGCGTLTSASSGPIDATTTGSTTLRYDSTANQYIYNWQTPATPGCYLLTVTLDDGTVYTAAFHLS